MTEAQYRAALKVLGLSPGKPSYNGATIYMDRDGMAHSIPDPVQLSPEERDHFIALLKTRIGFGN